MVLAGAGPCSILVYLSISEVVRVTLDNVTSTVFLTALHPRNFVSIELDLPASLWILAILETHRVATDAPLTSVVLALDDAIGTVEFRVYPGSDHATLNCVSGNGRVDLNSGSALTCKRIAAQGKNECCSCYKCFH